jgi:hypothetical protein
MRNLLEVRSKANKLIVSSTISYSSVFEDNRDCIELANSPRICPRTRHIGLKYHHFLSHVENGNLKISWIDSKHQLAYRGSVSVLHIVLSVGFAHSASADKFSVQNFIFHGALKTENSCLVFSESFL